MRVLHLTRDYPPRSNGGISTAVGGMVRASLVAGLECAVISFDGWRPRGGSRADSRAEPEEIDAVKVLRVSSPAQLPGARAFAEAVRPDLVHVHHGMLWELAAELRETLEVPAALTAHTLQRHQNRLRGLDPDHPTMSLVTQRRALAEADLVLAPSRAAAEILRTDHPEARARLRVTPLGIDAELEPRVWPDAPKLLYAGRFADLNGIAELIEALPRVLDAVPEARAVIAGGLPDNPKAERKHRRRFAESLEPTILDRVRFTGWIERAALHRCYREASILLAPSWFETYGQVIAEAMACGLAVVSTATGAIHELLTHEESGILVTPRDPSALAEAAIALCRDRARAHALGTAAASRALELRWPAVIVHLLDAYRSIASPGCPG